MPNISFPPVVIARFAGAMYGVVLNNSTLNATTSYAAQSATGMSSLLNGVYASDFGSASTTSVASTLVANLGITGATAISVAQNYVIGVLNAAAPTARGDAVASILNAFAGLGSDATYGAAATAWEAKVTQAVNYSQNAANTAWSTIAAVSTTPATGISLTTGVDNLVGTAGVDTFTAYILNNANTLQSGDTLDGGAGTDTLNADIGNSQNFAITPHTSNIENVAIRAEASAVDQSTGNNTSSGGVQGTVTIDAQRMAGVNKWTSVDSRADVIIEDVRIADAQITKDVTIEFKQSDPGNVDFGVYFNEYSLRNVASSSSLLNIQVMDTGAAATAATVATPLLNNPYDTFKFAANGTMISLALPNAAAADTYAQLLTAFQTALTTAGLTGIVATLGANFTVVDPISAKPVTGQTIVLTANDKFTITTPTGSGWFNTTGASVPATSNIYTTWTTGTASTAALVTSTVILDDVGMADQGGDLVIGGMSTGATSSDLGVQRFEITVNDNSRLQTINSTNDTLREVTIVNGTTSGTSNAYTATVANAGNLSVIGNVNPFNAAINGSVAAGAGSDTILAGTDALHAGAGAAGFTDVRLIDGSAMTGKLAFTAAITGNSIAKYVNLVDTQVDPAADIATNNTFNMATLLGQAGANFVYTGGANNDTMTVTIDAAVASSRSTHVVGQSDATFAISGGAGNDAITVTLVNTGLAGGAQFWYNNQKLNNNITIDGGDGNDTIRTPGAGDKNILGGTGDDTIYTDNTGALGANANATGTAGPAATAYANAATAELALAQTAAIASNTTGFIQKATTVTAAGSNTWTTPTAAAAALVTLDLATPVDFPVAGTATLVGAPVTHTAVGAAIDVATNLGGMTLAQNIALKAAYGVNTTAQTITVPITLTTPALAGGVANAVPNMTAAEFAAGNAMLAGYITAMNALAAAATSNDTNAPVAAALLDTTQLAVVTNTQAANQVFDPTAPGASAGTTESAVVTWQAIGAGGGSETIGGLTVTGAALAGGYTAANVALVAGGGFVAGLSITATPTLWTVGASGGGATNVFTSTTANTNVVDVGVGVNVASFTGFAAALPTAVVTAGGAAVVASTPGTQTKVTALTTLSNALVAGATKAQVVAAIQAAVDAGAITGGGAAQDAALNAAAGAGPMGAADVTAVQLILSPLLNAATVANATQQTALTAAVSANNSAVNTAAQAAAANPAGDGVIVGNDAIGTADTAVALANAKAALTAANKVAVSGLTAATTKQTDLAALKSAISIAASDFTVENLLTNAVAKGTILAANKTAIATAVGFVPGTPVAGGDVTATEKVAVDVLITALQVPVDVLVADATLDAANLQAVITATTLADNTAKAAAASGGNSLILASPKAVYVFNATNQSAAAAYNNATMDDRNLADLKSSANDSSNFWNSTVKVTYKGLEASVIVSGTNYKTTDLQINQAIKQAINSDAVLSKLLLATDGPANTLVVTSLIDGAHTTSNLAVTVTMPTTVSAADVTGSGAASEAAALASMATAKATFDARGDYTTQFAESGAAGGDANLTGANSTASTDNIITPGTGNDVIVLSTTVSAIDAMSSSNETVVYGATGFGNDTIVYFTAGSGFGADKLDLTALKGSGSVALGSLTLDKSIVVGAALAAAATPLTATQIAALFTDSATAINHIYVQVDSTNIGSVWQVADAAGTAAGNVTATLAGTIDLADTAWSSLTAANFA